MNLDDPKLTAFALNELDANEHVEVERTILEQPLATAEVAETREMAKILRDTLQAEQPAALCDRRRDAVLRAARIAGNAAVALPEDVTQPWWRRAAAWQVAAACAVFGFGVYALSVSLGGSPKTGGGITASVPEQKVHIGSLAVENGGHPQAEPGLKVPAEIAGNDAASIASSLDVAKTSPRIVSSVPAGVPDKLQPGTSKLPHVGTIQPEVVESTDPLAQFKARADIGKVLTKSTAQTPGERSIYIGAISPREQVVLRSDGGEVKLTGEDASRYFVVREYLDARWREASSLREGTTYAELARNFRHEATSGGMHRFVMIRCPSIKVDVSFATKDSGEAAWPVAADAHIRTISKPYFEPEQGN